MNWIKVHGNIIGILFAVLSYLMIMHYWIYALLLGIMLMIYTNMFANYISHKASFFIAQLLGTAVGSRIKPKL